MGEAGLADLGGAHAAVAIDRDVRHLLDLADAVVAHPCPFAQAGEPRLQRDAAAEVGGGLREMHLVAALAEGAGAFEAGGAGADDEYGFARGLRRDDLRMPAAPPLL